MLRVEKLRVGRQRGHGQIPASVTTTRTDTFRSDSDQHLMVLYDRTIFDLVDKIAAAASGEDIWAIFLEESRRAGLGFGYLAFLQDQDAPPVLTSPAMPKGWEKGYVENNLAAGDLLYARARAARDSFVWQLSDWSGEKLSPLQQRWCEHGDMFGVRGGLCILDFHPGREIMLVLCGEAPVLDAHDRLALRFAGHELIHRLQDFTEKKPAALIWLSQRERQCLEWAAAGKTDWEIGQILSLSEKTVNVYITRAKSKLGVKSRAQAILKASKAGVITI